MVEISKNELVKLEALLSDLETIINGDLGLDGLELFYSDCMHQHKRLRKILDMLELKFNEIYDLWDSWYNR